ncbi:alpha/beta fold hydrolase [Actibacterium pelagium]|uniref:Transcriptional regulator n=1 Tax=Actibacterium pelagium TaxID=2029103 RepID=A0A917AH06_9RHOB|nr:alpha/beta fold hydrolase [Actibacterium pelagium]GGE52218.1 transcriptional regulator [Actibacterium pelagium]
MSYRFANCSLDPERHTFLREGKPVHVEPQVFELILALVKQSGLLVTKEELIDTVWRGLNVSDATISARINAARKAVGDNGREQAIIKTVHGRGFQLIAEVSSLEGAGLAKPTEFEVSSQSIRFAASVDGAQIAYAQSGTGPPLIRVGHWLSHLELDWQSSVWRPLIDALGQDHTLYRYDQRGTGLSTRVLESPDLDVFVADLKAVADANDLDRFPVFAASQAVPVAIRFAQKHPDRVSGLVLYGGFAVGRALRPAAPDDIDETTLLSLIRAGWGRADSPFVQAFASLSLPDATPQQMESFVKMQMETVSPENAARLRQIVDRFHVRDSLPKVKAPTLVIHANADAMQPIEQGRVLASEIPNARYVALESRNHIPLPQEPSWSQMVEETQRFLESLG